MILIDWLTELRLMVAANPIWILVIALVGYLLITVWNYLDRKGWL